jgi:hypothetical protein
MTEPPSPQRPTIDLDGTWEFVPDPAAARDIDSLPAGTPIEVPGSWEAQLPGRYGIGTGWYRRTMSLPREWAGRRIVVRFDAVMYACQVWLNGVAVGSHEGGFTPFEMECRAGVRFGQPNELVVRVSNPMNVLAEYPPMPLDQLLYAKDRMERLPLAEAPHGKQTWYSSLSGIWQSVRLECRSRTYIERLNVFPDVKDQRVVVRFSLNGDRPERLELTVRDPEGAVAGELAVEWPQRLGEAAIGLASPRLWSIGRPAHYHLEGRLVEAGGPVDVLTVRFGMREIATRDGQILLNGEPIVLMGALDQDLYPLGLSAPEDGGTSIKEQFAQAAHMGLNLIRCHIKLPDKAYLDAADDAGILLWCELPNWTHFTSEAATAARRTLEEMVETMGNHPSIVIWTIINEDWGTRLKDEARDRRWLQQTYRWLKQLDPTRLVVDNSACDTSGKPNFHVLTDLADYHAYFSIPDKAVRWRNLITDFAGRPAWLWSPHGDAISRGDEPLVLSEFGNWGLPRFNQTTEPGIAGEWWRRTGGPLYRPEGAAQRFTQLGLERIWTGPDQLADATQWHQFEALQYQIGELRRHPTIAGYVITELTDAYWEANGLLDIGRGAKVFYDRLKEVNRTDLLIPELPRRDLWGGQEISVRVHLSSYGRAPQGSGSRVGWDLMIDGDSRRGGELPIAEWPSYTSSLVDEARISMPEVSRPIKASLVLSAWDADGTLRSRDERVLAILPSQGRRTQKPRRIAVNDPHGIWSLEERLASLGHQISPIEASDLLVSSELTPAAVRYASAGGRVLVVVRSRSAIAATLELERPVTVHPRWLADDTGTDPRNPWKGDWISTYMWILPGLFPGLPERNPLDFAYEEVAPDHVLLGYDPETHRDEVVAGMFAGWLRSPAALIWSFPQGKGRITATTFKLSPEAGPVASALLEGLIAGQELGHHRAVSLSSAAGVRD